MAKNRNNNKDMSGRNLQFEMDAQDEVQNSVRTVKGTTPSDPKAVETVAKETARRLDEMAPKAQAMGQGSDTAMLANIMRQIADQMDRGFKEIVQSTREVADLCRSIGKNPEGPRTPDDDTKSKSKLVDGTEPSKETVRDNPLYIDVLKSGLKSNPRADSSEGSKSIGKENVNVSDSTKKDTGATGFYAPMTYKKDDPGLYQATWGTQPGQFENGGTSRVMTSAPPLGDPTSGFNALGNTYSAYAPWDQETGSMHAPSFRGRRGRMMAARGVGRGGRDDQHGVAAGKECSPDAFDAEALP